MVGNVEMNMTIRAQGAHGPVWRLRQGHTITESHENTVNELQRERRSTEQYFPDSRKMLCRVVKCHHQQNVGEIYIQEGYEKATTTTHFHYHFVEKKHFNTKKL